MEAYKRAAKSAVDRFIAKVKPGQLAELRAVMLANNNRVMEEMARRGTQ